MKAFIAIVILSALPAVSSEQQSSAPNTKSGDCPLSYWSTTGAACQWAPDITPNEEARLKHGVPSGAAHQSPLNWLRETLPVKQPQIPDSAWMPRLPESIFKKMVPTLPDSLLRRMIHQLPDSVVKSSVPDSILRRLRRK